MELTGLRNIGPRSARLLQEVGITTPDALREVGAVDAFRRVRERFPAETSWQLLYALHGALIGASRTDLPDLLRATLRQKAGARN